MDRGTARQELPEPVATEAQSGSEPADCRLQEAMLEKVSRTFALTIPVLPDPLRRIVGNAYLLCRIVDTVEDEPALSPAQKERFAWEFVRAVGGEYDPEGFSIELAPLLSAFTTPAAKELIGQTPYVLGVTGSFPPEQRDALKRCLRIMAEGMVGFQKRRDSGRRGLGDEAALDRYCYHVAGVVGEMLTELFCLHIPEDLGAERKEMTALGRSFGQGLQMTNILKDVWDDLERGACWLPRSVFDRVGFNLDDLQQGQDSPEFERGLGVLLGVAHGHLANALEYTLRIPAREVGIRTFCLWSVGMAILTLRKINRRRGYTSGSQVKITRSSVKATAAVIRTSVGHDGVLRVAFRAAGRGLPRTDVSAHAAF